MQIEQKTPYLSIKRLPTTTLPTFTVLTGANGAGKTHLLRGIQSGHITTDITRDSKEIKYYDWSELVPSSAPRVTLQNVFNQEYSIFDAIRNAKQLRMADLRSSLTHIGLDSEFSFDPWRSTDATVDELSKLLGSENAGLNAHTILSKIAKGVTTEARHQIERSNDDIRKGMMSELINEVGNLATLPETYYASRPFRWRGNNMFQQSFSEMFLAYFDKVRNNKLRQLDAANGIASDSLPLSDADFITKHGEPPWDFVNAMMRRANLDFEIDHPVQYEAAHYQPVLRKISTNTQVDFAELSSGERVLMSFAFCLYYASDLRQDVTRPKILLFDEIDAPLHPSMSRTLVNAIKDVLVEQHGISVILATHSPSTVAVAPEESVYLLEPGTNVLVAESRRRAVATLTADIPTMSIDFSGRRQVFVESDLDAGRYGLLYQFLAPQIASERSLTFIGIGRTTQITGCAQVIDVVSQLAASGNTSVLGLIDWDLRNSPTDRIGVLGFKERYAIENFLLDPLLLLAALLNERPAAAAEIGLPETTTYLSLASIELEMLQRARQAVEALVISQLSTVPTGALKKVNYVGGFSLSADDRFLIHNGHELEEAVLKAIPSLMRYQGRLLMHMTNVVARNHINFLPLPIKDSMQWLLDTDLN